LLILSLLILLSFTEPGRKIYGVALPSEGEDSEEDYEVLNKIFFCLNLEFRLKYYLVFLFENCLV
jgi:hypothetical protein